MRERMSNVDAAWFRFDRPENGADVVALLAFDELPERARIRRLVEERLLAHRRFRQRAVPTLLGGATWEDDPAFALDAHLVHEALPSRSARALQAHVGEIASRPLDPAHPLWRLHVVEQPTGGAIVAKLSHCMADGFALVALFLSLTDDPSKLSETSSHVLPAARRLAPWLDPLAAARSVLADPRRALALGAEAAGLAAAAARMVTLPQDPVTSLQRPLSGHRRTAWSRGLALDAIRDAARAAGTTVNDVLLAAVSGALRQHLAASGGPIDVPDVRAMVPVNLRPAQPGATEGALGNHFGLVFLDLPLSLGSAPERLAAVHARTTVVKQRPDPIAAWMLLGAIGATPGVADWASRFFTRKASLVVTNVPGPREHLTLAERRVEHAMFWVPHPATLGLGVSLLSYAGEVRVGVRSDVAVLSDPAHLVARFEDELRALGAVPPRAEPRRRTAAPLARRRPTEARP